MNRFLTAALVLSTFSLVGLVGCEDKAGTTTTEKVTTPGGTTTTTDKKEVKSTGETPPTNSAGETAKPPEGPK